MTYLTKEERAAIKEARREENRQKNLQRQAEGRYKKSDSTARAPIAEPKGQKQRMQEFKERLLHAPTGEALVRKVLSVALDDGHPGQMTAMKMCLDRMLPVSMFEDKKQADRPQISINITGITQQPEMLDVIDVKEIDNG